MMDDIVGEKKPAPVPVKQQQSFAAQPRKTSFGAPAASNDLDDLENDGWGDIAPKKSTTLKRSTTSYAVQHANTDDMLDNILDDFEEKKGISTKEPVRPKTANQPLWSAARNDHKDDLDMLVDEPDSSAKGSFLNKSNEPHQRSNDEILQRKKSLFGVQPSPQNNSGDLGISNKKPSWQQNNSTGFENNQTSNFG